MRAVAIFVLAFLPLLGARPITHEDVWLMKRVGNPVVSPDGKYAVFSVTEPSYENSKQVSDLWIADTSGQTPPRRLTFTKGGESGVNWSPDSRRIAFSAKREGDDENQIYVLSLDGGEAVRYTSLSTGARSPVWSPDGRMLLFESDVYPGASDEAANKAIVEERKKRKWNARVYETFPIRYWDRWIAETRPNLFVMEAKEDATPRNLLAGTKFASSPGFQGPGTGSGGYSLQAVWAPDGKSAVFTASLDSNASAHQFTTLHLYQVALSGGEPKALTAGGHSYSQPAFRPDGKALYAIYSRREEESLYSNSVLAMFSWPAAAAPKLLTTAWDRSVGEFAFASDSRTLFIGAEEHGHDKLFRMPAEGGTVQYLIDAKVGAYGGLASATRATSPVLLGTFQSTTQPAEVVRVDLRAGTHTALTSFNAARLKEIQWHPVREFWFDSKRGARIHNMMVVPPDLDESKKYPLLVMMHGGPHNMWKDQFFLRWNFQYMAAQGYVILMTNYSGSTGFGEKFADSINRDVLRLPAADINDAADEAIRRFRFIDAQRQVAGGASYGGYLANWMLGTTTRYRALFNHAGLTNHDSMYGTTDGAFFWEKRYGGPVWESKGQWQDQNPLRNAANFKTPMLVTHGERDYRVPLGQGLEIYKLLQRQQVPAKLIVFPDENHWILSGENNKFFFEQLFDWLNRWLDAAPEKVLTSTAAAR